MVRFFHLSLAPVPYGDGEVPLCPSAASERARGCLRAARPGLGRVR